MGRATKMEACNVKAGIHPGKYAKWTWQHIHIWQLTTLKKQGYAEYARAIQLAHMCLTCISRTHATIPY